jgi:uncharacterized protein
MRVKAREARGQGTADARVHMTLADKGGATGAKMATDLSLSGRAASMGRGVIGDVASKLLGEFAANLAQMLGAGAPAPAAAPAQPVPTSEAPPVAPAPPAPAPPPSSSLPVGRIAAGVVGGRLSDPRTLLISAGAFAAIFTAIGFGIGRRYAR